MNASVTLVTAPSARVAERIARALVEARLAACVNLVPRVTSIYAWKGRIVRDGEVLLVIKSARRRHRSMERRIRELHPYEVPEILHLGVAGGSRPYLDWIAAALG